MAAFSIQGISLSAYDQTDYEGPNLPNLLVDATADGANYVELGSIAEVNLQTGAIGDYVVNEPNGSTFDETANFSDIGPAIAAAEAQGLQVMLKPQIGAVDPTFGFGNLTDPNEVIADPAAFFANYEAYILQWAELAQQYHVAILSIGNEMLAATKPQYTPYWDAIIAAVRQVYSGELTYSALLPLQMSDTAYNEVKQIQFWNLLDFAGFDVYPSLTTSLNPSVAQLNAAWQKNNIGGQVQSYVQSIDELAESVGKPVLFTETGVASFPGATDRYNYNDSSIGLATTKSDYQNQANWWASFFDTWAVNKPAWLAGIFVWNNTPGDTGAYYSTGYDIDGKPAEEVVSSWYGGRDYLSWSQKALTGSIFNDQICLYGDAVPVTADTPSSQAQTFATQVSVTINGTIIDGQSPTVHFYINGIDEGAQTLDPSPDTYVDASGVTWSVPQTFAFSLNGLVDIDALKIVIDSPVDVGGPENAQTDIWSATVDGVALSQGTYDPLDGGSQQGALTSDEQYDGGYELIDASPWNDQLAKRAIGTAGDPIVVNGGGGTDTVNVLGTSSDYTITRRGTKTVDLAESSGLGQNAILNDIAFVVFQDGSIMRVAPVNGGAAYSVAAGQTASDDSVLGRGSMFVDAGGTASATTVNAGGLLTVESGGSDHGTTLRGAEMVFGLDAATDVMAGGGVIVAADGTESGVSISRRGRVIVSSGGTVDGATVYGLLQVVGGGTVEGTTVASGGTAVISSGSIGAGAMVEAAGGGVVRLSGTIVNSGTLFADGSGGAVVIAGVVDGGVAVIGDGIVDITAAGAENVAFESAGTGGLELAVAASYSGSISGFGANSTQFIDLTAITSAADVSLTYTPNSSDPTAAGVLDVSSGGRLVASLDLVGDYQTSDFALGRDAKKKVTITDSPNGTPLVAAGVQSANIALFRNYLAASRVDAAGDYGGTIIAEPTQEANAHVLLASPRG